MKKLIYLTFFLSATSFGAAKIENAFNDLSQGQGKVELREKVSARGDKPLPQKKVVDNSFFNEGAKTAYEQDGEEEDKVAFENSPRMLGEKVLPNQPLPIIKTHKKELPKLRTYSEKCVSKGMFIYLSNRLDYEEFTTFLKEQCGE